MKVPSIDCEDDLMKQHPPIQPFSQLQNNNPQVQLMIAIELLNYNGPIFTSSKEKSKDKAS